MLNRPKWDFFGIIRHEQVVCVNSAAFIPTKNLPPPKLPDIPCTLLLAPLPGSLIPSPLQITFQIIRHEDEILPSERITNLSQSCSFCLSVCLCVGKTKIWPLIGYGKSREGDFSKLLLTNICLQEWIPFLSLPRSFVHTHSYFVFFPSTIVFAVVGFETEFRMRTFLRLTQAKNHRSLSK